MKRLLSILLPGLLLPMLVMAGEPSAPTALSAADLVKQATQQSADKHRIEALADGRARVPAPLQGIEALAAPEGITVTSTVKDEPGNFTIRAAALGRVGGTFAPVAAGTVAVETDRVRIVRPDVVEELTTSAEGVRQDFVVPVVPQGTGDLALELTFSGATLQPKGEAVAVTLAGGRELLYHHLLVTDSADKTLSARFELLDESRLRIVVADAGASYPLRIDPTITDTDWVGIALPDANSYVFALAWDGTNLYAGGAFTGIGGIAASHIAKWNGSAWSALGSGMNDIVRALAWDGTNLYAGGFFTTAGGVSASRIAQWNGSAWSALGSGMSSTVYALAWDGTNLYAGGGRSSPPGGRVPMAPPNGTATPGRPWGAGWITKSMPWRGTGRTSTREEVSSPPGERVPITSPNGTAAPGRLWGAG